MVTTLCGCEPLQVIHILHMHLLPQLCFQCHGGGGNRAVQAQTRTMVTTGFKGGHGARRRRRGAGGRL